VVFAFDGLTLGQEPARAPQGRQGYPTDLNAYVHIGADGRYVPGREDRMGQGAMTSLPQLVAEELDVPCRPWTLSWATPTSALDMGTFGSLSIRQFGPILRAAAAEARAVLLQLASERLQAPVVELTVDAGTVVHAKDGTRRVTYGQLTEGKRIERRLEASPCSRPSRRSPSSAHRRRVATPSRRSPAKAKYAGDIVPPGALHARILGRRRRRHADQRRYVGRRGGAGRARGA